MIGQIYKLYGLDGYGGLGAIIWTKNARHGSGIKNLQSTVGTALQALGKPTSGVLPPDGALGPSTGNALTYLLGPNWYNIPTASKLNDAVLSIGSVGPYMGDLPTKQYVKDIQAKLNIAQDGELGPATWTKITTKLGVGEAWAKQSSFKDVRDAVVLGTAIGQQLVQVNVIKTNVPSAMPTPPANAFRNIAASNANTETAPVIKPGSINLPSGANVVNGGAQFSPSPQKSDTGKGTNWPTNDTLPGSTTTTTPPVATTTKKLPPWVIPAGLAAVVGALVYVMSKQNSNESLGEAAVRLNPFRRRRHVH